MPTISVFFGLVVHMYFFDDERHHLPHIHVKYQDQEASFSIAEGGILRGNLPPAKTRLVQAWIEIRRKELMANWDLASSGQTPSPIDPLR